MATCNYIKQPYFDLYHNLFEYEPYDDAEPCFDEDLYYHTKNFLDNINKDLQFFEITLKDGYYDGVQTFVTSTAYGDLPYEFDAIDFLEYSDEYDGKEIYNYTHNNRYVLKRKIQAEMNKINFDILPQLIDICNFERLGVVGRFSNGEVIYEKI